METLGGSRIAGIGAYLPEKRVTSDELMAEVNCKRFGIPEDYISRHIGIVERRVADPAQSPSDLATLASESALRDAGVTTDEIDLLIYTGITRDCEEPSTAHFVQRKLSAENAVCMDVSNACLGFMTGLSVADTYIAAGVRTVLVCTGEMPSTMMNEAISVLRRTREKHLFKNKIGFLTAGDGGGAMVIRQSADSNFGMRWMKFWSRGSLAELCHYKKTFAELEGEMLMKEISREILAFHAKHFKQTYESLGWSPLCVDKVYCHQVGDKPHKALVRMAGKPLESAPITYDKYGNLTSATIPVDMHLNPPERGSRLLFLGTGSGLTICQGGMVF